MKDFTLLNVNRFEGDLTLRLMNGREFDVAGVAVKYVCHKRREYSRNSSQANTQKACVA